jgi:hypothetical protein
VGLNSSLPAIDLSRLSGQLSQLISFFDSPKKFSGELQSLFSYYSYRVQSSSRSGPLISNIHDYRVPPSLIKQIQKSLDSKIYELSEAALLLAKELWTWHDYESCLLAAYILGKIPRIDSDETIHLLISWLLDEADQEFYKKILDLGLWKIQSEQPDILVPYIEDWLASQNMRLNLIGFCVITTLITNDHFENLPVIFDMINPYLRKFDDDIKSILVDIIRLLIKRSPVEIAFLLRKNYEVFQKDNTAWLIRQTYSYFPETNQTNLKKIIRTSPRDKSSNHKSP